MPFNEPMASILKLSNSGEHSLALEAIYRARLTSHFDILMGPVEASCLLYLSRYRECIQCIAPYCCGLVESPQMGGRMDCQILAAQALFALDSIDECVQLLLEGFKCGYDDGANGSELILQLHCIRRLSPSVKFNDATQTMILERHQKNVSRRSNWPAKVYELITTGSISADEIAAGIKTFLREPEKHQHVIDRWLFHLEFYTTFFAYDPDDLALLEKLRELLTRYQRYGTIARSFCHVVVLRLSRTHLGEPLQC